MLRSRLLREGSIGLFLLLGVLVFGGIIFFLKGARFRNNSYTVKLQFENAGGLTRGGRVLYRGVEVGRITDIQPSSNGIAITTEIHSKLPIPQDVTISTTRSGLLGEVSISLTPQIELDDNAKSISPLSEECLQKELILCHNQTIQGNSSPDLIATLTRLAEIYSDPELFNNLNSAVSNIALAGEKAAKLSDDLSAFMLEVKGDINTVSQAAEQFKTTADSISRTADTATEQINKLTTEFTNTSGEISLLVNNLNNVIDDNRNSLSEAIINVSQTTKEISQLAQNADTLISRIDQSIGEDDLQNLIANLQQSTANFEEISNNLLALSKEINNPTNLVTLQQTLDSARVTFANTAKITSDLDQLTGDPQFRRNLRRLVDGLSNLVSYTDMLEKQVQLAIILESAQQVTVDNSSQFSQFKPNQKQNLSSETLPNKIFFESENLTDKNKNN